MNRQDAKKIKKWTGLTGFTGFNQKNTRIKPPIDADKIKSNKPQRTQRAPRKKKESNHDSRITTHSPFEPPSTPSAVKSGRDAPV
jgi:hypothetical protein